MESMPASPPTGRWIHLLVSAVLVAGVQTATASPASAAPGDAMQECRAGQSGSSSTWSGDIAGTTKLATTLGGLKPGSVIRITASGSVHNGSWFGQWRGPDGSLGDPGGTAFWPASRVNKFALYGKWMRTGETFHAGSDSGCLDYTGVWRRGNHVDDLAVGVNDDVMDDNSGSFRVTVRVWTNPSEVNDGGFERQPGRSLSLGWVGEGAGFKGVDVNRGLARVGKNNAFIRTTTGWNAVAQPIRVVPHRRYRMAAFVRTSGNFTGGVYGVRPASGGSAIAHATYGEYAVTRYRLVVLDFDSGPSRSLTVFIGYWAPGVDSWLQIDDVQVWAH